MPYEIDIPQIDAALGAEQSTLAALQTRIVAYESALGTQKGIIESLTERLTALEAAPAVHTGTQPSRTVNVRDFGATGDNRTDDTAAIQRAIDAAYGPAGKPDEGSADTRPLYFPGGNYIVNRELLLPAVQGTRIYGDGRLSTQIKNLSGGGVFHSNGFAYSRVELLSFVGDGPNAVLFNMDWNNADKNVALEGVTFEDCHFLNQKGGAGLSVGRGGYMGSESLLINCHFQIWGGCGFQLENYNALQWGVLGGNFQQCRLGIDCQAGSVPKIDNVGFQSSAEWDISITGAASDAMMVTSCRSESPNFMRAWAPHLSVVVAACVSDCTTPGVFYSGPEVGASILLACRSQFGHVEERNTSSYLERRGCFFADNWLPDVHPGVVIDADTEVEKRVAAGGDA
ncbi:MAG: glycoside hydrolase family 55 protein [Chloroflexi bacterium]|nr:glycoside hydrolase family 55 protein [Chloroflexota bacterium]